MLEEWQSAGYEVIQAVLGQAETLTQMAITVVAVAVVASLVAKLTAHSLQTGEHALLFRMWAIGLGLLIMLAAATATKLYLVPKIEDAALQTALLIGIPLLAGLLIAIPLQTSMLRANFSGMFVQFTFVILLSYLTVLLVGGILSAWEAGGATEKHREQRQRRLHELIEE